MNNEIILIFQLIITIFLCIERIFKRCKKSSCCNHFIDLEMIQDNDIEKCNDLNLSRHQSISKSTVIGP